MLWKYPVNCWKRSDWKYGFVLYTLVQICAQVTLNIEETYRQPNKHFDDIRLTNLTIGGFLAIFLLFSLQKDYCYVQLQFPAPKWPNSDLHLQPFLTLKPFSGWSMYVWIQEFFLRGGGDDGWYCLLRKGGGSKVYFQNF